MFLYCQRSVKILVYDWPGPGQGMHNEYSTPAHLYKQSNENK